MTSVDNRNVFIIYSNTLRPHKFRMELTGRRDYANAKLFATPIVSLLYHET